MRRRYRTTDISSRAERRNRLPIKLVPAIGGVLIRATESQIFGAVGISGDTGENDEICAIHGIESAGLVADAGGAG